MSLDDAPDLETEDVDAFDDLTDDVWWLFGDDELSTGKAVATPPVLGYGRPATRAPRNHRRRPITDLPALDDYRPPADTSGD